MSPEKNFLAIDFRQVDQKSQSLGKLVPQKFIFHKIDIFELII